MLVDCFWWVPFCGVTKSCMREGGWSGDVLHVFGSEGGCLLVSMRLVVLRMQEEEKCTRSNFSCEIPRAAAEETRRWEKGHAA
jgi:hypothetical protein